MLYISLPLVFVILPCIPSLASAASGDKASNRPAKPGINIGRFHIGIDDDRFNFTGIQENRSIENSLFDLWIDSVEYWLNEDSVPTSEQASYDANLAQKVLKGNTNAWANYLNETTYKYLAVPKDAVFSDTSIFDYTYYYQLAVLVSTKWIDYYRLGAYTGVGRTVECAPFINQVLSDLPEWEKAGSNAAINVMLLLPTFLAFGNLYVPRSSEVFATSLLVGISCAVFSLGLPVKSISAVREKNHIDTRDFRLGDQKAIARFSRDPATHQGRRPSRFDRNPTLSELQSWTDEDDENEAKQHFAQIRAEVDNWTERRHWWHLPAILVAMAQWAMFIVAVAPLLTTLGAPRFLFNCQSNWTGWYLGISAGVNALLRLLMWESGYHERAKIYALSAVSQRKLSDLVSRTSGQGYPDSKTTADEIPPLYPPTVERLMFPYHAVLRFVKVGLGLSNDMPENRLIHDVKGSARSAQSKWRGRLRYMLANPWKVLRGGGINGLKDNSSARRWRPVICLIHLEHDGRSKLFTLLTGFVEALLLLVLTFFFAAQWGGNLYVTGIALLLLLVFITAGRAVGVMYVMLSAVLWGLHIVHCSNHEEIRGCLRIICSMKDVLVCVNGASYYNGYKLDGRPGFDEWRTAYENGADDANDDDHENHGILPPYPSFSDDGSGRPYDVEMTHQQHRPYDGSAQLTKTSSAATTTVNVPISNKNPRKYYNVHSSNNNSSDDDFQPLTLKNLPTSPLGSIRRPAQPPRSFTINVLPTGRDAVHRPIIPHRSTDPQNAPGASLPIQSSHQQ